MCTSNRTRFVEPVLTRDVSSTRPYREFRVKCSSLPPATLSSLLAPHYTDRPPSSGRASFVSSFSWIPRTTPPGREVSSVKNKRRWDYEIVSGTINGIHTPVENRHAYETTGMWTSSASAGSLCTIDRVLASRGLRPARSILGNRRGGLCLDESQGDRARAIHLTPVSNQDEGSSASSLLFARYS